MKLSINTTYKIGEKVVFNSFDIIKEGVIVAYVVIGGSLYYVIERTDCLNQMNHDNFELKWVDECETSLAHKFDPSKEYCYFSVNNVYLRSVGVLFEYKKIQDI